MYVQTYMHVTSNEKELLNLKEIKDWREGGKGRGEM